jgi:hypothetical protein
MVNSWYPTTMHDVADAHDRLDTGEEGAATADQLEPSHTMAAPDVAAMQKVRELQLTSRAKGISLPDQLVPSHCARNGFGGSALPFGPPGPSTVQNTAETHDNDVGALKI